MPRLMDVRTLRARAEAYRSDPGLMADVLQDTDAPEALTVWLKRLERLYGVPFNYLVPNERMLPNESIRFFNVDFNWLFALLEGACSIGTFSEADAIQHAVTQPKLRRQTRFHRLAASPDAPGRVTGFLMRSQIVPGWPGLEVLAYDKGGTALDNVIRMERLAKSILLFAVEGVIDKLIIREPATGLHYGINVEGGKFLRYVTVPPDAPPGTQPGDQIPDTSVTPQYRDARHRTIKMNHLAQDLSKGLQDADADNKPDGEPLPFTSAEFALQLVEGTQEVTFQSGLAATAEDD